MSEITLKLDSRTIAGKKVTNLRKNGIVPSVVYGKAEARNTQAGLVEVTKAVHTAGKHSPITLEIDGKKKLAIIKSVDVEPVRHRIRHVAFHTINQNEAIVTEVPIRLVGQGESAAEKAGLIVLQALEHTEIKAKPGDLPEALELSVENLATADDKLTLGDIKLPSGVEFADHELDLELVVANVYEPSALQAQNEAAAGDAEDAAPADDTAAADEAPAEEE